MTVSASLLTFNPISTAIGLIVWAAGRKGNPIENIAATGNPRFSIPAKEYIRKRDEKLARKNPPAAGAPPADDVPSTTPPTNSTPPDEAFAPPVPPVLPPVEYAPPPRAPTTTAPPFGSAIGRVALTIGEAITRLSVPLFGVIWPAPGGAYDEYTDIPLDYRIPPRKPPTVFDAPLDPITPPNWQDIAYEPNPNFRPTRRIDQLPYPELPTSSDPDVGPGVGVEFDPGVFVPSPADVQLPDFDVEASPVPSPWLSPAFDVLPLPPVNPGAAPRRTARPQPTPTPTGNPYFQPVISPPRAEPIRLPSIPGLPSPGQPFLDPLPGLGPNFGLQPLPQFRAAPASPGDCVCTETKPKKRAPPKDRTVCYSGTFREYSRGQTKIRRKEVPCESKKSTAKRLLDSVPRDGRSILSTIPTFF